GVKHIVWPSVDGRGPEQDPAHAKRVSPLTTREVRGLWLPSHTRWLEPLYVRASLQRVPLGRPLTLITTRRDSVLPQMRKAIHPSSGMGWAHRSIASPKRRRLSR